MSSKNRSSSSIFVDLTKAFDTLSRSGLYKELKAIGRRPFMVRVIASFQEMMQAIDQYDGSQSDNFAIISGVKKGCILAPTHLRIYFAALKWSVHIRGQVPVTSPLNTSHEDKVQL